MRCSYAPFNVQQNALFATAAAKASASNATFRRKGDGKNGGLRVLTDRQHGWVFTLQLLCQSADLSIYINLLSHAIVVVIFLLLLLSMGHRQLLLAAICKRTSFPLHHPLATTHFHSLIDK